MNKHFFFVTENQGPNVLLFLSKELLTHMATLQRSSSVLVTVADEELEEYWGVGTGYFPGYRYRSYGPVGDDRSEVIKLLTHLAEFLPSAKAPSPYTVLEN